MGLFDERGLFELTREDFPEERLMARWNPELAKARFHKRQALLQATIEELDRVKGMVARGRLRGQPTSGSALARSSTSTTSPSTSTSTSETMPRTPRSTRRACPRRLLSMGFTSPHATAGGPALCR
jgi:hypothetical protein